MVTKEERSKRQAQARSRKDLAKVNKAAGGTVAGMKRDERERNFKEFGISDPSKLSVRPTGTPVNRSVNVATLAPDQRALVSAEGRKIAATKAEEQDQISTSRARVSTGQLAGEGDRAALTTAQGIQGGLTPEEAQLQLVEQPAEQFLEGVQEAGEALPPSELTEAFSSEFGQRLSTVGGSGLEIGAGGFNDLVGKEYAVQNSALKALNELLGKGEQFSTKLTIADIDPSLVTNMFKSGRDVDKLKGVISQTGMISGGIEELAVNNGISREEAVAQMKVLDNELSHIEQQITFAAAENPDLKYSDGYGEVIQELKDQRIEIAAKTSKVVNEAGTFNPEAVQFIMDDLADELGVEREDILARTKTALEKKQGETFRP